jgi:hypothetical protein
MSLVPDTTQGKLTFFQARAAGWVARADEIGATPAAAAAVADRLAAARAKYDAAYAAREAARNATAELKAAVRDLMRAGADVVKQVRAKAAVEGDGVYSLALIPPPAAPSRIPAPGLPTGFTATLLPDGALKLRWKCPNPANAVGTVYQVSRRIGDAGGGGPFVAAGVVGKRTFVDTTLPAGTASVTYEVVAVRSTATGVAARFVVNFGVSNGEAAVVGSPKLAA